MRDRMVADKWAAYRELVVPADAGKAQVSITRDAFYAGAIAIVDLIISSMSPGPDVSREDDEMIQSVLVELSGWAGERSA